MKPPIKNIKLLPAVLLLTSKTFLDIFHQGEYLSKKLIKRTLLQEIRKIRPDIPNHLIKNLIDSLLLDTDERFIFLKAVEIVSEYFLEQINGKVYVKNDRFEEWQNILTLTSGIPFIAYTYQQASRFSVCNIINHTSLIEPEPNNPFLPNILKGLTETHMHINGTSETIYVWQHYLNTPKAIRTKILQSKDYAIELDQIGLKTYGELYRIFLKAKNIQNYLSNMNSSQTEYNLSSWRKYLKKQSILKPPPFVNISWRKHYLSRKTYHPMMGKSQELRFGIPCYEAMLWHKILFDPIPPADLYILPHYYLLSFSLFHRLLTQQINQYGFDQFQIITDNKVRDSYEDRGFRERFRQLNGNRPLEHVELRFTPKKSKAKYFKFFSSIFKDYQKVSNENSKNIFEISSVAHFIKRKEEGCTRYSIVAPSCLQKRLFREGALLVAFFSYTKYKFLPVKARTKYLDFFKGIDAAGNELYARPEVFAPTFRYIRSSFLKNYKKPIGITFHAGEEFTHLVSGIRYIYEAIHFLQLQKGDRIGHATALGISHKEWRQKYNDFLVMKIGEYLDNLIFISKVLDLDIFEDRIGKLWTEIYNNMYPGIDIAFEAYMLRKGNDLSHFSFMTIEKNFRHESKEGHIAKLHSLCRVQKQYNKLIQVSLTEVNDKIIQQLQNYVLNEMRQRKIAIESMITSNTRISIYDSYKEHHIVKWIQNPFAPPIVLASDDPGIFNTNLKNEYHHLFAILKKHFSTEDALKYIEKIKNNGNEYRF